MMFIGIIVAILVAQSVSIVVWRLVLGPLSNIPGPKLAALTSWYEFYYDVIKPGQFVWHIQQLHLVYGPIIRITPWEIHISDPSFLDEVYAPASRNREKYAFFMKTVKVSGSTGTTVNHDIHRRRREALNPFFSKKAITAFESVITDRVAKLDKLVHSHILTKTPINLSDAYYALANDVVSYYCFGRDEKLLDDEQQAATHRNNISELLQGIKAVLHLPWIFDILDMIPFPIAKHIMPAGALDMRNLSETVKIDVQRVLEDTKNLKKGHHRSIFYELRDNKNLPPSEKSLTRLENEGTLLVLAGTDSPAKSMAITHFYLLHHPEKMAQLRSELQKTPKTATWKELEQLPYLSGCIAEGNRLSFGVAGRTSRIAPHETLQYKQYAIPPGTPVSETTLSVHTNEFIFPEPWAFKPERWLGKEGTEIRKYQMAFNKGSRSCVGMNLAHAEMFLAIAAIARYDMKLYETDVSDVKFKHEFHVAFPKLDSKGIRAVVEGKVA